MKQQHWTSYGEIFNLIVSTMTHDYAGYAERKDRNDPYVGAKVSLLHSRYYHGDDATFLREVRRYLGLFGDPGLELAKAGTDPLRDWESGFGVRATDECLYVTENWGDDRLSLGDRILKIGGKTLLEIREGKDRALLGALEPEREDWSYFLRYASSLEVEGKGVLKPLHLPVRQMAGAEGAVRKTEFSRLDEKTF